MIVQCPNCSTKCRIQEEKIPEAGGRFTCPACEQQAVVYSDGSLEKASDSDLAELDSDTTSPMKRSDVEQIANRETEPETDPEEDPLNQTMNMGQDYASVIEEKFQEVDSEDDSDHSTDEQDIIEADLLSEDETGEQENTSEDIGLGDTRPAQTGQSNSPESTDSDQQLGSSLMDTGVPFKTDESSERQNGPDPEYDGPWRLKTDFGLTYEFPDTESLQEWLENRTQIEDYELGKEHGEFYPLDAWPQANADGATAESDGEESAPEQTDLDSEPEPQPDASNEEGDAGASDIFHESVFDSDETDPIPSSEIENASPSQVSGVEALSKDEQSRKSGSATQNWAPYLKYLYLVIVLLVIVIVLLGLQLGGYDLRDYLSGEPISSDGRPTSVDDRAQSQESESTGQEPGSSGSDATEQQNDEGTSGLTDAEHVQKLVGQAKTAIEKNRFQSALEYLTAAQSIDDSSQRVYELLETVHRKLGNSEKAKSARKRARELNSERDSKKSE